MAVIQSWKEKSFELQVMKVSLSQLMRGISHLRGNQLDRGYAQPARARCFIKRGEAYSAVEEVVFGSTTWAWATILNLHVGNVCIAFNGTGTSKRKRETACMCGSMCESFF